MSEPNEVLETEKPAESNEEKAKQNKGAIKPSIIRNIAAIICCVTLIVTSTSIANKVCDNKTALAQGSGTGAAAGEEDIDALFADAGYVEDGAASADGTSVDGTDTATGDTGTATGDAGSASSSTGGSASTGGSSSTSAKAAQKEITLTSGLQSANIAEIQKYYKLVAAKNAKAGNFVTKMTMTSLDGGSGAVGGLISAFKPIATSALEKNSTTSDNLPGKADTILEADWQRAVAVNDGTYTTLTIQLVNQTDGANGKCYEGTVGRSIGVLDGVQTALDNLPGVSADFAGSNFSLLYDNAYIKIKVKNSTGELVKGANTWHYRVNVNLDNLTVKVGIISATLKGAKGTIDYTITH